MLSGLGQHADPVAGGTLLALPDRGGSGHADGTRLHCLRQLCLAGPVADVCASGASPAFKLAGHARQRDHGQLRRAAVGSLLSLAVLVTDRGEALELRSSSIGSGGFRQSVGVGNDGVLQLQSIQLSTTEQLDSLSYRTITVGFLMLTVGIVSGAVWANEAWGSYWSWDPKETWALICWLVYAAYLHTRLSRGWQGRRPALVAVAGLVVIAVCYIGVNLLGIGLHSYGWFFGG